MIVPHSKLKTVQDWIYDKLNKEEADLFDYERPLKIIQTKKPAFSWASLLGCASANLLTKIRSILP